MKINVKSIVHDLDNVYLKLDIYWGLFHLWLTFNYALHFPHVVSVSTSCSSYNVYIYFLLFSHCFLKNA